MNGTIFDLLERIKEAPGMYLGYPSVQSLFMFLNGYDVARDEAGIELTEDEEIFYDEFQPWLQRRLGVRCVASWAKLIMLFCHDERTGFERFFELLSEFRQQQESASQQRNEDDRFPTIVEPTPNDAVQSADSEKALQPR